MAEDFDQEFQDHFFEQLFSLWVTPELERRKKSGDVPEGFRIVAIQVLFDPLGKNPRVRFNEEVHGIIEPSEPLTGRDGEFVSFSELGGIRRVELLEVDADCGHITVLPCRSGFTVCFELRCNSGRIAQILSVAPQFLSAAEWSLNQGHLHAFVESLWSAVELMAKGQLLSTWGKSLASAKSHQAIRVPYNNMGRFGWTEPAWAQLYNRLTDLRPLARYLEKPLTLTEQDGRQMLSQAREMFEYFRNNAPTRTIAPPTEKR